jgi:hypothetical protein
MIERLRKASLQLLLLIVMPVFGVGALLFFAHGECNATSKVLDAPPSGSVGAKTEPEPVTIMLPPPPQDSAHSVTEVSGREATTAPESTTFDNETADDKNRKRPATRGATTLQRPVTSPIAAVVGDKDMKATAALVHHATSLETARRWTEARAAYQQLEKAKGYSLGEALYHEAWCAYQSNAFEDAVHLAAESASMAGPFRMRAMMLYGDGLYRRGEYARAKNILLGLLKSLPVEERARAAKEIAACNDKLGLEPADGIRD